ncbi:MAG TPA: S8 family serine peptidase [Gammaproteobacteria bacterium]
MNAAFRSMAVAAIAAAVLLLLGQGGAVTFAPPAETALAAGSYVPGEVLVKFKTAYSAQHRISAVAVRGHALVAELNQRGWVQVKIGAGQTMEKALAAYRNDPDVEYVQPNYIYRAEAVPNDTQYGQLWAFRNIGQTITTGTYVPNSGTPGADINIEKAWDHITDCSSIVVAVIDSGVNYNQEDLAGNMWNGGPGFPLHGTDFVANDNDPMDLNGHGTHVAGIIAASGNNSTGTTGVCWEASVMAVRVLDTVGVGTTASALQGVNFAVNQGAKVINMSLTSSAFDQALSDAITHAQANDVVVVVAAGNQGSNNDSGGSPRYPCNFTHSNLICVAALDQNYALASFSNWGATSVDVGAPGTNIRSAWPGVRATIADDFNTGGTLDWTASGGGWAYSMLTFDGNPVDVLVNPPSFPSGTYSNNADNRVYKAFDLSDRNAAILRFSAQVAVQPGDSLNVNFRSSGGDPFADGGVQLIGGSGNTGGVAPFSLDLSACLTATCSAGFQLLSNASGADQGAGVLIFGIETLQLNNTSYHTINGTSMATPMVAALAAMLRSYNPQYTHADVVNSVRNGGRSVAALDGKTTSGRAIDAMSSLAYINPPAGLAATVD